MDDVATSPAPTAPADARWARALVTGASSGIGEAIARQLGAAGTALVLVARSKDRLDALAEEIRERSGVEVEVLPADLADHAALGVVEARVADDNRPIDLLVNNAGYGFNGEFGERPVADEEDEILVNVLALMRLTHAAVRRMTAAGTGGVLNVASTAAFQPAAGSANYSATKAYVLSFSQSVHEEVRSKGVAVTTLCPGLTRTEFQDRGGYDVNAPGFTWQTADEVARAGLDAVARGKAVEVTGWHNKVIATSVRKLPMGAVRFLSTQVTERFS